MSNQVTEHTIENRYVIEVQNGLFRDWQFLCRRGLYWTVAVLPSVDTLLGVDSLLLTNVDMPMPD